MDNNDTISRKWLRTAIIKMFGDSDIASSIDAIINNAPTVDINTELSVAYLKGRMQGQSDERPQGEWITKNLEKPYGKCNQCGEICEIDNYCGNCGAKMRKGGAE